jgi:ribosomal protein L19E
MKSTLIKQTLGLLALGLAATGAHASWDRHDQAYARHATQQSRFFAQQIDTRQDRQMDRIEAGMRQGRLTRAEYRKLMHEQREIRAMERHFRADGMIDAREFRRLDNALDVANSNIRDEKHDRQARNGYDTRYRFN